MNFSLISLEVAVVILALGILLGDLWTPLQHKRKLGYAAVAGLILIFIFNLATRQAVEPSAGTQKLADFAFGQMFVLDGLATFFKQFFILAAILVLIIAIEFADRIQNGISEFYSIILFALAGMLFASSANDLVLVFVALELITISFYILNSFQRNRISSLEAGIKYLILGAVSTGFFVFGLAFVFGTGGTTNFSDLSRILAENGALSREPLFLAGVLFIIVSLAFKIAAFPLQIWAPDVYQGSPAPATTFLAVGSKAAGIVLLMRFLFVAVPQVAQQWVNLLIVVAAITILYGNLCAIPQRNLKRLLGYSSISNAGYMLLGFAALTKAGSAAVLYYLAGYLFTVVAAFSVIVLVTRHQETEDITVLAGLNRRSPFLAATLSLAMVSLAGIPPLAGFFGKFLLLKSVIEQGENQVAYYFLAGAAIIGVVMSLYYYFNVIRVIYWSKEVSDVSPIAIGWPTRVALIVCILGMLYLGLVPEPAIKMTSAAVAVLNL